MSNTVNVIHIKASPEEAAENLLDTLKGELQRKGDVLCNTWTELHTLLSQPGVVTVEDPTVLSVLQDKGSLLSTTWNELYNLIAAYQTELSSRESQVVTAWSQIQNKDNVSGDVKKRLSHLEEELRKKNESMSTTQATITTLLAEQKNFDTLMKEKQAKLDKLQSEMEERETVLSNFTLENLALTAKVEELEGHIENVDPGRKDREATLEKYKSEVLRLSEENSNLMDKLKMTKKVSEPQSHVAVKVPEIKVENAVKLPVVTATAAASPILKVQPEKKQQEAKVVRKVIPVQIHRVQNQESKIDAGQGDAAVSVTPEPEKVEVVSKAKVVPTMSTTPAIIRKTRSTVTASPAVNVVSPVTPTKQTAPSPVVRVVQKPKSVEKVVERVVTITPPTRTSGRRRKAELQVAPKSESDSPTSSKEESSPMRSKRGRLIKTKEMRYCKMGADCSYCMKYVSVKESKVSTGDGEEAVYNVELIADGEELALFEKRRDADRKNKSMLCAERARDIIECVECGKSRVVYSMYKPSDEEKKLLGLYLGSISYMCGFPLFTSDCELYNTFVVREQMSCCTPIETTYYRTQRFAEICYYCGTSEDLSDDDKIKELKKRCLKIRPLCQSCLDMGLEPVTTYYKGQ